MRCAVPYEQCLVTTDQGAVLGFLQLLSASTKQVFKHILHVETSVTRKTYVIENNAQFNLSYQAEGKRTSIR